MTHLRLVVLSLIAGMAAACAPTAAVNPIGAAQRILEDRSAEDISLDTQIFASANRLMAKYRTVALSTLIYEQHLVVYGVTTNPVLATDLRQEMAAIGNLKKLSWDVVTLTPAQKEARVDLMDTARSAKAGGIVESAWALQPGLESTNFRIGIDSLGTAFVMGRAKTQGEKARALSIVRGTEDVRKVVDYTFIRP